MLSGSLEGWRRKDTCIIISRYYFKSSRPQFSSVWPTLPGSILLCAYTAHLWPLVLGLPCWCQGMGYPGSQANPSRRCVGVVSPVLWELIFGPREIGADGYFLPHFFPGTYYPETKMHSCMEDSLQGLNRQLPLASTNLTTIPPFLLHGSYPCLPLCHLWELRLKALLLLQNSHSTRAAFTGS